MSEAQGKHNVILENRSHLVLSRVTDVDSFNEEEISLFTQLGELTIRGTNLHINEMSVESGELSVEGDYEVTEVTMVPVCPNVALRKAGFFKTRTVGGMAYPDFYQSTAFAMCDHEVCVIVGPEREKAAEILTQRHRGTEGGASGNLSLCLCDSVLNNNPVLVAPQGSWFGYEWWTDRREAPDFASHVDIHNKPGYDPKELFFFNRGVVKGTHGRNCEVAYA